MSSHPWILPGMSEMLVLDTCAIIYDTLTPERMSETARASIADADDRGGICCCGISLWEIAMLVEHGRLDPGTDTITYIRLALTFRNMTVLPITPEIACTSASLNLHGDPADRLIAATAIAHGATLITSDARLIASDEVPTLW